jgi:hypothetical protein
MAARQKAHAENNFRPALCITGQLVVARADPRV